MKRLSLLLLGSLACYGGEATLGGACEREGDCGDDQSCSRSICSSCGDGVSQAGEVCLEGPQATEAVAVDLSFVTAMDADGDGRVDLVWPTPGALAVARGSDDGFSTPTTTPFDVSGVWSGDFDGDGLDELLVRDSSGGVSLQRPDASGALAAVTGVDLERLRGLRAAVVHPDVGAVGIVGGILVRVSPEGAWSAPLPTDALGLAAATSLDGEGPGDVVVTLDDGSLAAVFVSDEGLSVQPAFSLPSAALDVAVTRWNADGLDDVVTLQDGGQVHVWLSDGVGGFVEGPSRGASLSSTGLLVADLNEDRAEDVLTFGPDAGLRMLIRRGSELDAATALDPISGVRWARAAALGDGPFSDLVLYDGATFSVLERNP